jgi:hypothetical protein
VWPLSEHGTTRPCRYVRRREFLLHLFFLAALLNHKANSNYLLHRVSVVGGWAGGRAGGRAGGWVQG